MKRWECAPDELQARDRQARVLCKDGKGWRKMWPSLSLSVWIRYLGTLVSVSKLGNEWLWREMHGAHFWQVGNWRVYRTMSRGDQPVSVQDIVKLWSLRSKLNLGSPGLGMCPTVNWWIEKVRVPWRTELSWLDQKRRVIRRDVSTWQLLHLWLGKLMDGCSKWKPKSQTPGLLLCNSAALKHGLHQIIH